MRRLFGYIKPYVPSLTVAQHEAYKAVYCGLCREMGKVTGQSSRLFLSFDLTYLAVFRMAIEKISAQFDRKGCVAHPLSKRLYIKSNSALNYCACAASILTSGKIEDNKADEKGVKKLSSELLSPIGKHYVKRAGEDYKKLSDDIFFYLSELSEKEKRKESSIDSPAESFAGLLSRVASHGLVNEEKRIAEAVGYSIGKIIYVLDAADDAGDDIKHEKYNPLALVYGKELIQSGKKPLIEKSIADGLYTAICLESERLCHTLDLADFSSSATLSGIIYNVADAGIKASARHVLYGTGENEDPFRHRY